MTNNDNENKIKMAYEAISLINKEAYKDIFLISNQVLSKSPFNNNFLNRYLNNERPKERPFYVVIYKLLIYYIKSFLHFAMYLFKFVEFFFSSFRFSTPRNCKELILIDIVFIMENIKKYRNFSDLFLPGMEEILIKRKKHYAYLPFFYSPTSNKRPFELLSVLRILKKEKVPVITEYQLLSVYDLLYLLYFIVAYPFHVLRFSKALQLGTYEAELLKCELIDTLDQVAFYSFSRYLFGRQIVKLPYDRIKAISWYENQPIHKNLYKGLRENASKVRIYGAQLFLYSKNYLTLIPDENEECFGIVPDKILVNGPYYVPEKSKLNYTIGPSLRYSKIFHTTVGRKNQKNILILLPYIIDDAENILRILLGANLHSFNIFVKTHPGLPIEKFRHLIPSNVTVVKEDTYKLFGSAKIVISATSGTLLEAASLGIPVISIKNTKRFDYNNPFSENGKGIIWEEASKPEDLIYQIKKFERILEEDAGQISIIADRYKRMFFCEPTERNIITAFDLEP